MKWLNWTFIDVSAHAGSKITTSLFCIFLHIYAFSAFFFNWLNSYKLRSMLTYVKVFLRSSTSTQWRQYHSINVESNFFSIFLFFKAHISVFRAYFAVLSTFKHIFKARFYSYHLYLLYLTICFNIFVSNKLIIMFYWRYY